MTNAQRGVPVDTARLARVARCAARSLRIRTRGTIMVTCLEARRMRALNRRFLGHDRVTDVLSFRYDGRPAGLPAAARVEGQAGLPAGRPQVIGDVLIAPSVARAYAARHSLPYAEELARYVVHGLLHWLGLEDRTSAQQHRMRAREDQLLDRCGVRPRRRGR